jgi:hypothetical protein
MTAGRHWQKAIPRYLMISLRYFLTTSLPPLAVVVARSLLTALRTHRLLINRIGVELSLIFGGIFFLLAFLSAAIDDVRRNWKTQKPTVAWNPLLLWRNFIYLGAVGFFIAAFLDFWCYETMRSRIEPMKKIARTLRAHRTLLLNYFKARKQFSSGVIEGLNNKAKVTMRRSYGFRTFRILELALYHSLGKLPQPELTHEFF